VTFSFIRNTLCGSYLSFSSDSRSNFAP